MRTAGVERVATRPLVLVVNGRASGIEDPSGTAARLVAELARWPARSARR